MIFRKCFLLVFLFQSALWWGCGSSSRQRIDLNDNEMLAYLFVNVRMAPPDQVRVGTSQSGLESLPLDHVLRERLPLVLQEMFLNNTCHSNHAGYAEVELEVGVRRDSCLIVRPNVSNDVPLRFEQCIGLNAANAICSWWCKHYKCESIIEPYEAGLKVLEERDGDIFTVHLFADSTMSIPWSGTEGDTMWALWYELKEKAPGAVRASGYRFSVSYPRATPIAGVEVRIARLGSLYRRHVFTWSELFDAHDLTLIEIFLSDIVDQWARIHKLEHEFRAE